MDTLKEFESAALEGLRRIRAFWDSTGSDKKALEDAKFGASAIGSYTRLRATIANEEAIAVAISRHGLTSGPVKKDHKRLTA